MNKTFEYILKATGEVKTATIERETLPYLEMVGLANTVVNFTCPRGQGRYFPYYQDVVYRQCLSQAYTDVKISDLLEWIQFCEETNYAEALKAALDIIPSVESEMATMECWIEDMVAYNQQAPVSNEFFRALNDTFDPETREAIKKLLALITAGMDEQAPTMESDDTVEDNVEDNTHDDVAFAESEEAAEEVKE